MIKKLVIPLSFVVVAACVKIETDTETTEATRLLSVEDIKREYEIADSLNRIEDRSQLNFETVVLGIDKRNNQVIIRTPVDRGFGCLLFSDYFTLMYVNCDSVCCENNGFWLVDYVGFAGFRSPVGCAPDTTQQHFEDDCDCGN